MQQYRREDSLSEAMEKYGDSVYRLALCRLGSKADAENVFQDVFLRLFNEQREFRDDGHLKAWLLRVAINRCADMRRNAWFKKTVPLEAAESAVVSESGNSDLWQAVASLPKDLCITVTLHYVEGYATDEIAEIVGCRPATVRTRLHRARKLLKTMLGEDLE